MFDAADDVSCGEHNHGLPRFDLTAALDCLTGAASASFQTIDERVVCDTVVVVEKIRRFLDATECHALAELEARSTTDRLFGQRTASWLADQASLPSATAKSRVKTAKALAQLLPDADKALAAGEIGFDHARVLAFATNSRNVDEMAGVSGRLCEESRHMTFHRWRRCVEEVAELFDQDGGHDPSKDLERNSLRLSATGDTLGIRGELVGENYLVAQKALNAIADELFLKFKQDNKICPDIEIPGRPALLALALVEACRRGIATPIDSTKPGRPEASIVLTPNPNYPTGPGGDLRPGASGTALKTPLDENAWECRFDPNAGLAFSPLPSHVHRSTPSRDFAGMAVYDDDGNPLHQRSWRTLLCDPDMYTTIVDSLGVPLDMGRKIRFANAAQRRALALRDGGCTFPGCSSPPAWTDAHHSRHWEHGGSSDLSGLASLCRHHHGVAHRRGWSVTVEDDGWTLWTSPSGESFYGQQHQQRRRPPPGAA